MSSEHTYKQVCIKSMIFVIGHSHTTQD